MVGATGAGVAASSAGVGCRRCRGVEQALQAGPPPTQLAGWRTFLMRFTSAEPMRRLTPAITAKGTRYTVEAGPQARVQGCSGGQGRDVGGRVRSRVEARVGGQGRGGGGAGLWLVVGAPRTSRRRRGTNFLSASRITAQRAASGCTPIGISRRSSRRRGRSDREAIFKAWCRSAPTRRLAASVSWAGADDSLARQRWPRSRAAGGADDSLGRQRCSRSDRPRAGAGRPRLG